MVTASHVKRCASERGPPPKYKLLFSVAAGHTARVVLRIWLIQGKEKRLLARILEILEVRKCEEKRPEFYKEHLNLRNYNVLR